jgi:hypothetical protein
MAVVMSPRFSTASRVAAWRIAFLEPVLVAEVAINRHPY